MTIKILSKYGCGCPSVGLVIYASRNGKISPSLLTARSFHRYCCMLKVHTEVGCRFRHRDVDLAVKTLITSVMFVKLTVLVVYVVFTVFAAFLSVS